jgi:hypothetical protein
MDAQLKVKWVEALRSGKFKQGKDCLKSDFGHCCLGVLCEISGDVEWESRPSSMYKAIIGNSTSISFLPFALARRAAISAEMTDRLVRMNDNGAPFPEIADYIEKNL